MANFKLVKSRFDNKSFYLFYNIDKNLYVKNGINRLNNGSSVNYYKCLDKNCNVKGKVLSNTHEFLLTGNGVHTHNAPDDFLEYQTILNEMKDEMLVTSKTNREAFAEAVKG